MDPPLATEVTKLRSGNLSYRACFNGLFIGKNLELKHLLWQWWPHSCYMGDGVGKTGKRVAESKGHIQQ